MIKISNRQNKPKKTAMELVRQLKEEKGITFDVLTEEEAVTHLSEKNNYLRTASYRKNFYKHADGAQADKYMHLDFRYLVELSRIDMYLRPLLLKMCIDLEHALKVALVSEIENNEKEDGYQIVDDFLSQNENILHNIENKAESIFTGDLIAKYFSVCYVFEKNGYAIYPRIYAIDCPVWVLVEIVGFGDLIKLYEFYRGKYPQNSLPEIASNILRPIKSLRNACAHNNCLLNSLEPKGTRPPHEISVYVSTFSSIGKEERKKKLSCRPLFEIVCLLKAYTEAVSRDVREKGLNELKDFVNGRMRSHMDFFAQNQLITTSFDFLQKMIDKLT